MSRDLKKGEKQEKGCDGAEKVVVAVKASKDIAKTALVWALTHVVQPGDCITLLVVISSHTSGKYWALLHVESSVLFLASFFALIESWSTVNMLALVLCVLSYQLCLRFLCL